MKWSVSIPMLFALLLAEWSAASGPGVDFVEDVRPILEKHCYSCHGASQQRSGLRLDVKSAALSGGELYGQSIVPGNADKSPLVQFVSDESAELVMPPAGARLSSIEIATLTKWVEQGANWPDGIDLAQVEDPRNHWSFKPLRTPAVPAVGDETWPRNDLDRFVLAKLEAEGLRPSSEASRATWLRRTAFNLTGLPPTPEQVRSFLNDRRSDAYERAVDELLASPRYGERWAQHWLDVVRYADTHGFEVNTERPHAWPYRDYGVRAFNHDKPYDQFIREQIAGDAFRQDAATGFLVTASVLLPGQIGKDAASIRLARQDALNEVVVNIGQTFLGLSIGCARCHDHRFDPISQRDYYAMQAFVAGVEYGDRKSQSADADARSRRATRIKQQLAEVARELTRYVPLAGSGVQRPPVNARLNHDRFAPTRAKRVRFTIDTTNELEPCIDELEIFAANSVNIALARHGTTVDSSGDTTVADRHELQFINDGRYGNSRSWMSSERGTGWVILEFPEEHVIERVSWGRDREGKFSDRLALDYRIDVAARAGPWRTVASSKDRRPYASEQQPPERFSTDGLSAEDAQKANGLAEQQKRLEDELAELRESQLVFAGTFRKPDAIHLLRRGDPEQPQEEVLPTVLSALGDLQLSAESSDQQRRRALADWIASPHHPLTARVMVNRLWQGHFGTGLVETPNDFGRNGAEPSHPGLLDWLAAEFIRSGWSVKQLHRRIVLSATYRQSRRHDRSAADKDADVRLLWCYPSRRLDAEAIRDSALAISGELDLKMYGRGYDVFDKRGGLSGFQPIASFPPEGLRRMIYAHKVRRERDAVFGAFDCPDGGQSTPRRRQSTTPIQALNLFNSVFTLERASAFAERVRREAGEAAGEQVQRAYQIALNRDPTREETEEAELAVRKHGLIPLCRALLNSNEVLFLP